MYQFFVEPVQIRLDDRRVVILGEDVNHIRNVLRIKPGEELNVSNGKDGREYRCAWPWKMTRSYANCVL